MTILRDREDLTPKERGERWRRDPRWTPSGYFDAMFAHGSYDNFAPIETWEDENIDALVASLCKREYVSFYSQEVNMLLAEAERRFGAPAECYFEGCAA